MGLSWQQRPLSPGAIGRFLVPEPLPKRLSYAEPLRRRKRVRFGGTWIADSESVVLLFEPGHYPMARLPQADVSPDTLQRTEYTTRHQDLGLTSWDTVRAGEHSAPGGAWQHIDLPTYASELQARVAFAWPAMAAFCEDDERVAGHVADSYHPVDIRQTSRSLVVRHRDRIVANTKRPFAPRTNWKCSVQQLQLDTCGELMDSVYLYNKHGSPISSELWSDLRRLINWTSDNWVREDEGIWETRGGKRHFIYSKLMCWVALDRALRLADKRSFPADRDTWLKVRDHIYEDILDKGWSAARQSFVQYYGSDSLDASSLIMPLVFFMAPSDPRMLKTLDAIHKPPDKGGLVANNLVYRYSLNEDPDGLRGGEGTFNMCTFWLVEALTRAGRVDRARLEEARLIFERMLGYANHLGLYAEETGPSGEALDNFPQAFTHLALISAAYNLDRALDGWR